MSLTNAGRNEIAKMIINDSPTLFTNATSYIGVGDSTTAFAATQTDLQAVTNKLRKGMEETYPTRTDNALTFKAVFGDEEANYTWNEWGVFNASTGGTMLCRKVSSLGQKVTGVWSLTIVLTVSIGS